MKDRIRFIENRVVDTVQQVGTVKLPITLWTKPVFEMGNLCPYLSLSHDVVVYHKQQSIRGAAICILNRTAYPEHGYDLGLSKNAH